VRERLDLLSVFNLFRTGIITTVRFFFAKVEVNSRYGEVTPETFIGSWESPSSRGKSGLTQCS